MDKPLILEVIDFTTEITEVINKHNSNIPAMIMADKLRETLRLLDQNNTMQVEAARQEYEKSLEKQKESESNG